MRVNSGLESINSYFGKQIHSIFSHHGPRGGNDFHRGPSASGRLPRGPASTLTHARTSGTSSWAKNPVVAADTQPLESPEPAGELGEG